MPAEGQEKKELNFIDFRVRKQLEIWPQLVRGEQPEGVNLGKVDKEVLTCCLAGTNFRGEGLSMEALWELYIGEVEVTEEEEARGKKKAKTKKEKLAEAIPIPIKARRMTGWRRVDERGVAVGDWNYGVHLHDDGYLHFDEWLYARDQARKDLMWLNREVLENSLVDPLVHRPICDQFVQKNFDGVYQQGYTVNGLTIAIGGQNRVPAIWDDEKKNYVPRSLSELENKDNYHKISMTQDARDFFKSTIGRADAIQWMLAVPDISMIILCADNNLAHTFVSEIKKKFFLGKGATPKSLHLLFPEYVLRGVKGTSDEPIECPARRIDRPYPTLWADSIESTLSGLHCDVLKFDDVVSNKNCQTEQTRTKLNNHINTTLSVNDTWGWVDFIGTRYFPDDYYGQRQALSDEDPEAFGIKLFVRAAWYVKPEYRDIERKSLKSLEEHMVTLTFPSHASWKFLRGKLVDDQMFRCQYLNQPVWGQDSVTFTRELLASCYMNALEAQRTRGDVYCLWDTAKEAKKNSDWTVGAALKVFQKEDGNIAAVVLEVIYGKWTQSEIAFQIASFNAKWRPRVNQIEDTGGLELLKKYAITESQTKFGLALHNTYWHKPENEDNAKRNRIKGLEILMRNQRFYFSVAPWNEECFSQFVGYTGSKSTRVRKDDIPDAMSYISKYLPSTVPMSPREAQEKAEREEQQYTAYLLAEQHKHVFGDSNSSGYYVPPNVNFEPPEQPSNPMSEISKRLFGGNGMRA